MGSTDYGYVGFECDITRHLKADGDNVILVRAGTALAILRSSRQPGTVTLNAQTATQRLKASASWTTVQ